MAEQAPHRLCVLGDPTKEAPEPSKDYSASSYRAAARSRYGYAPKSAPTAPSKASHPDIQSVQRSFIAHIGTANLRQAERPTISNRRSLPRTSSDGFTRRWDGGPRAALTSTIKIPMHTASRGDSDRARDITIVARSFTRSRSAARMLSSSLAAAADAVARFCTASSSRSKLACLAWSSVALFVARQVTQAPRPAPANPAATLISAHVTSPSMPLILPVLRCPSPSIEETA